MNQRENKPEAVAISDFLVERLSFLKGVRSPEELSVDQRNEAAMVIATMFRFTEPKQTAQGLRKLLQLNHCVVKQLFFMMDDPEIDNFLKKNRILSDF